MKVTKVFQVKTSTCRDGTLKNQPNKMAMTPQHIHTIPTSCAILHHITELMNHKKYNPVCSYVDLHSLVSDLARRELS